MFLSEPAETAADLRFWLFGVHIRVSPWFWLISAVLGWGIVGSFGDTRQGLMYLAVWVACVFISVLLHEMGHVFTGRLFGSHGHIVLHGMGGLAIGSTALNHGWQRFLVCFAGPLIQLVLAGVLIVIGLASGILPMPSTWDDLLSWLGQEGPVGTTLGFLLEINVFWAILNLFPIWPLDGGQMAREAFIALSPRNGVVAAFTLSAVAAGLLALHCVFPQVLGRHIHWLLFFRGWYMAFFFAYFAIQSIMALQTQMPQRRYNDDEFPWER